MAADAPQGHREERRSGVVALRPSGFTAEQNYALETVGHLTLPHILGAAEVAELAAGDAERHAAAFDGHPEVARCLQELFNPPTLLARQAPHDDPPRWRAEGPAKLLGGADAASGCMTPRGPLPDPPRGYAHRGGVRTCGSVTAVWALTDSHGDYVALPGSHRAVVPAPLSFRQGLELGWLQQRAVHVSPQLRAGDLLLVCGTAVHGLRPGTTPGKQLLLSQTFIAASLAPRGLPSPTPQPALPWTEALTERQRSRMGLLPQPPSEVGEEEDAAEETELQREQFVWDTHGVSQAHQLLLRAAALPLTRARAVSTW